ncbi:hypothetical protein DPMN_141525 [Dreissena polymorpha]|uniref:Uncharacterized protein n=1 Tax=Dreissena polymorpha TaxID=45954 RepID=A0A9D4G9J3_DREPO|nr:hypothetical protein DPMN_141525 [Dreissena polymorpha]
MYGSEGEEERELNAGCYIRGWIAVKPVTFIAVPDASRTIASTRVYDQLSIKDKPVFMGSVKLRGQVVHQYVRWGWVNLI